MSRDVQTDKGEAKAKLSSSLGCTTFNYVLLYCYVCLEWYMTMSSHCLLPEEAHSLLAYDPLGDRVMTTCMHVYVE